MVSSGVGWDFEFEIAITIIIIVIVRIIFIIIKYFFMSQAGIKIGFNGCVDCAINHYSNGLKSVG